MYEGVSAANVNPFNRIPVDAFTMEVGVPSTVIDVAE
jgi:hypothetical protein